MAYVALDKSDSDPGKSIKASWGDQVADNEAALYDWLGKAYTPADNHNHNGVNSAGVDAGGLTGTLSMDRIAALAVTAAKIANATVTGSKIASNTVAAGNLKTTTNTVSHTGSGAGGSGDNYSLTNSGYLFYPRLYRDATASTDKRAHLLYDDVLTATATPMIYLFAALSRTAYAEFRYVQASPPHAFADSDDWGLFVFLLRDKSTGEIRSSSVAEDPLWDGDWSPLPKNHPARIAQMPHPFADWAPYTDKLPADHGLEIVLVDLREQNEIVPYSPRQALADTLANERQKHLSLGLSREELDAFESAALAKVEDKTEMIRAFEAFDRAQRCCGKTLATGICERLLPGIDATKEIKSKEKLPKCDRFRDHVRVLRAE